MAGFSSIFSVLIVLISFLVSSVRSSRSCFQSHETTVAAANKAGSIAQDHQSKRMGEAAAPSFVAHEESERKLRQAPSGSDHFHHDNNRRPTFSTPASSSILLFQISNIEYGCLPAHGPYAIGFLVK